MMKSKGVSVELARCTLLECLLLLRDEMNVALLILQDLQFQTNAPKRLSAVLHSEDVIERAKRGFQTPSSGEN